MSRSRMFGDDEPGSADNASPRRTIVGGRPPEPASAAPPVPTGIQRLLRMAALDGSFLAQLVERRAEVAPAAGVELTATEVAILRAIPGEQLIAMAARMPPPAEPPRREFLRQSAATAVVLLGGAALAACDACSSPVIVRGATADMPAPLPPPPLPPPQPQPQFAEPPPPRPDVNDMQTEGGAAPDEPPPRPDQMPPPPAGIRPDIPPEPQPPPPYPSPPGGARPDMPPEPETPRPEQSHPTRGIRSDDPLKKK